MTTPAAMASSFPSGRISTVAVGMPMLLNLTPEKKYPNSMAGAFRGVLRDHQFTQATPATIFAHRHQNRCTSHSSGDFLPVTFAARGKTRGLWCAGAVGVFYSAGDLRRVFHGANRRFFWLFEPHNSSQQSCEGL